MNDYAPLPSSSRFRNLTGKKFGTLTVLGYLGQKSNGSIWAVACDCGTRKLAAGQAMLSGATKTCGGKCHRADRAQTHGMEGTLIYRRWSHIVQRCTNPKCGAFKNYGGRGIKVCDRWRLSFAAFYEDVGDPPFPRANLDRIDNDGHYEPGNVRWSTYKENGRHTRKCRMIEFRGETRCLSEWADVTGISAGLISIRLNRLGWPIEHALTVLPQDPRTAALTNWRRP